MLRAVSAILVIACVTPSYSEEIDANVVFADKSVIPNFKINTDLILNGIIKGATNQFTTSAPLEAIERDGAYAAVGRGYDPITNTLKGNTCVKLVGKPDAQPFPKTQAVGDIKTTLDIHSLTNTSASAVSFSALIKTVSIGFASSAASVVSFNSIDKYGRMYRRVVTDYVAWPTIAWKDKSFESLAKTDRKDFIDKCGTRWVQAVYSGTLFDQIVRYELKSDGESSSNSASLGVGVKALFAASASFSDAEADAKSRGYAHIHSMGVGSLNSPPPPQPGQDQIAALFSYYYGGVDAAVIKDKGASGVPLYIIVSKYYTDDNKLPYAAAIATTWSDDIMKLVTAKSKDVDTLMAAVSEIDNALSNDDPNKITTFYIETKTVAAEKRKKAEDMITDLNNAIINCQGLANGPETLDDGHKAINKCNDRLNAALPSDKLASVQLTRK